MQHLGVDTQLLGGVLEKIAGQGGNVLAALGETRNMNADHVQAVEQVFPEVAVANQLFQILVGGGNDAHIHMDRGGTADPVEFVFLQHTQ